MSENKKIEYGMPWKDYKFVMQYNFPEKIVIMRTRIYALLVTGSTVAVWKLKSLKK